MSKEELEECVIKQLRMKGLAISDFRLIEAMDNSFDDSKLGTSFESNVLDLKISKEGKLSKMPMLHKEDIDILISHMKKTLKEIGNEILSGNIQNEPLIRKNATSPCDYCSYQKICHFDKSLGNKERRLNELKDEEVIQKIKEEKV